MFVQAVHHLALRRAESGISSSGDTTRGSTMGSGWRKARKALRLNVCASAQADPDGDSPSEGRDSPSSEASTSEPSPQRNASPTAPVTPTPTPSRSSSRLNLIRSTIGLSRNTCAICLESMKAGQGQALFTAECGHTSHFSCIALNVRHGNLVCPVCRAKWKEVPWQAPPDLGQRPGSLLTSRSQHLPNVRSPVQGEISPDEEEEQRRPDPVIRILDESIANARGFRRSGPHEPSVFDDDEPLSLPTGSVPAPEAPEAETQNSPGNQQTLATEVGGAAGTQEGLIPEDRPQGGEVSEQDVVRQSGGEAGEVSEQDVVRQSGGEAGEVSEQDVVRQSGGEAGQGSEQDVARQSVGEAEMLRTKMSAEIVVTCHPEVNAVAASEERDAFTVLIHLKSSANTKKQVGEGRGKSSEMQNCTCYGELTTAQVLDPSCRAPLDLVTVLDISGSMAGTKLVLLKRAMAFVIRNLSPADRLSVVAFSSSARRLFPLRRMVEDGRRHALRCVESLVSTGGTNIADGLKKGAKMLEDRRMKNPVASIMLLSDGQDTYTVGNRGQYSGLATPRSSTSSSTEFRRLLPGSLRHPRYGEVQVPVHTFGFGADHDAATMHSISEVSGGTFSFIQAEAAVQDAFAQCIGGLLSVVSQATTLSIATEGSGVQLINIQAGSYEASIDESGRQGEVKLGDLYAEEERDILLELKLPAVPETSPATTLLWVSCSFHDPVSTSLYETQRIEVQISRPAVMDAASQTVSLEVDRQRNRVQIAQSILEAGQLADTGEISAAQQILIQAKDLLRRSVAFQVGDQLSASLESEVTEIQLRVADRQSYERTGRAYILSAQSSHFQQRATTRGDGSENSSREYQTSSMADMVIRSQTLPSLRSSASGSSNSTRDRRSHQSGRLAMSPSPTRMLLRRSSGRVQDSHGHHSSSPS